MLPMPEQPVWDQRTVAHGQEVNAFSLLATVSYHGTSKNETQDDLLSL